jgi:DNA ligase-1
MSVKFAEVHLKQGDRRWSATIEEMPDKTACADYEWYADGSSAVQKQSNPFTKGKNVGKANETTPTDQAVVEVRAKVNKKIMEGFTVISLVGDAKNWELKSGATSPLPMLAHEWSKHQHKMPSAVLVQPKLDGIRCIANCRTGELFSRKGEPILSMPHITEQLKDMVRLDGIEWYDGELYSHELDFQEITSIVRKQKGGDVAKQAKVNYNIYDCIPDAARASKTNRERQLALSSLGAFIPTRQKNIKFVETVLADLDTITQWHQYFVDKGYEGCMVRDPEAKYQVDKRSTSLLKVKTFLQEEFEVLGVVKEDAIDTLGTFTLQTKEGKVFQSRPAFTDDQRQAIWNDRNTYDWSKWVATVKFQEWSNDKIPRFNTTLGLRFSADT